MSSALTLSSKAFTSGWLALGACIALAIYSFNRSRRLLVRLPGPPNPSWIMGHFRILFGFNAIAYYRRVISKYGPTVKMNGPFGDEFIWTIDPTAMHSILVKDRFNFERLESNVLFIRLVMGGGLFGVTGDEHRIHRKLLNPVFNMKFLRELFMNAAERTCVAIEENIDSTGGSSKDMDIFPWTTAAALELIGEAGLGYSFDSFSGKRNDYSLAIKDIARFFNKVLPFAMALPYLQNFGTASFRRWVVRNLPISNLQKLLDAMDIQNSQAEEVLCSRQALLASGGDPNSEAGRGKDIMTLLMKANENEGSETHISREDMIGHMNIFMFAGHETTSTSMSRILNILADNEPMQTKLREEVLCYFEQHADDTTHDALLELRYLDAIVREAMRMHSPVTVLPRESQVDTTLPLEYPIETPTGKITSIPIKKGTRIVMSILMANLDSKTWGERANEFWPERWMGSKLDEVTKSGARLPGVYSSMWPDVVHWVHWHAHKRNDTQVFLKFAVLEIKVMIAALVKTFRFEPSEHELRWETLGIQMPYLASDSQESDRVPKLPIRVVKL